MPGSKNAKEACEPIGEESEYAAYSWDKSKNLLPPKIICSPVIQETEKEKQHKLDLAAWIESRTFPQDFKTDVQTHAASAYPDQLPNALKSMMSVKPLRDSGITVRCLQCGEVCRDHFYSMVTRSDQYFLPERRTFFMWGTFCERRCRRTYTCQRWFTRENQALVATTLCDKITCGLHWDISKDEGSEPFKGREGRVSKIPIKCKWESVELFYRDISQGVDEKDLSEDCISRWNFRKRWRAQAQEKDSPERHECDSCLQEFNWKPVRMVTGYEHGVEVFHPHNKFCDPSCWKRFIIDSRDPNMDNDNMISVMARYCGNKLGLKRVFKAPPREAHVDWLENGLSTQELRDAPYQYQVIEFMVAPFVGSKMRMNRNPCLHARDIVDELWKEWELTNGDISPQRASLVSKEVSASLGSRPKPPEGSGRSEEMHNLYRERTSLRSFLPFAPMDES